MQRGLLVGRLKPAYLLTLTVFANCHKSANDPQSSPAAATSAESPPAVGGRAGDPSHEAKAGKDAGAGKEAQGDGKSRLAGGRGRGGPVTVRVANVERKVAPRIVYAVAPLEGREQADVFSRVLGRITYIGPKEGEPVKINQILFRIDRSDPGETYLNAPVVSPLTGWVALWHVNHIGEQVSPSDPVVTVVDDRALKATAYLPSDDWLEVTPDTVVAATVGSRQRTARVATIARAADLASGRGSVSVTLDNAARDWRSGMYARFKFELAPKERTLVSASSLIITDQGAFVYVAEGEQARRVPVKFQLIDGDTVEITQGLDATARVVTAGANLLGDKSAIKIVD